LVYPIEYLKGVGPQRADLLKKELGIFTFNDLLHHFPYRHIDKTKILKIADLTPAIEFAQVQGILALKEEIGEKAGRRLVAYLRDETGIVELTWFKGISWMQKILKEGEPYVAFGRVSFFMGNRQILHPEIELKTEMERGKEVLEPVYSTTEKLKVRGLGGRQTGKLVYALLGLLSKNDIPENLPQPIIDRSRIIDRFTAYFQIHFPKDLHQYNEALRRLKFEELFISQLRLALVRSERHRLSKGVVFKKVGDLFNSFYKKHLPFELTSAQKRVVKEIRVDTASGHQMNRLLQGDVGSGKTIVALLSMLLAIDNGFQCCMMAPTEILVQQHYRSVNEFLKDLPVTIKLLTGSTKTVERKKLLLALSEGSIDILIGTHALIEEVVQFKKLGLAIVDEQHRFGVAQRALLWKKAVVPPHVLVMTATPIPRTLAMTAYGDLDYSVMNELPPGRKPIATVHRYDTQRTKVMDFIKSEIHLGRQVYIIFPLIEESAKLDYENLMQGYKNVKAFFPEPKYWISMIHGRQTSDVKEANMQRFVKGDTQIMVSTTVIEVGVNVPNASVMIIESAEKFGLSQLHQLRGRVGRGAEKSYCILMTSTKIGADAKQRISIITSTGNGFEVAEKDLELRGPGDIEGTRQSGALALRLADLVKDKIILEAARVFAEEIVEKDFQLESADNLRLKYYLLSLKGKTPWSKIS
jgi:ATP-dependent DNA helicase RecG